MIAWVEKMSKKLIQNCLSPGKINVFPLALKADNKFCERRLRRIMQLWIRRQHGHKGLTVTCMKTTRPFEEFHTSIGDDKEPHDRMVKSYDH